MTDPLIQIRNLSKSYGGVQALLRVSLDIARGEIHGLCGENGAGKSTLIKILSGSVTPDEGGVLIAATQREGEAPAEPGPSPLPFHPAISAASGVPGEGVKTWLGKSLALPLGSVRASEAAGIAVIHQESVAFPHLNTFDNLFVGREPRRFGGLLLDRATRRGETRALLQRLGENFDPGVPLSELSVAQRQMVGIARALSQRCRLLIMDEPTASLSVRETTALFRIIRDLQSSGVSILYVSHRLDEIFELCSRVTVLRDGKLVATRAVQDVSKSDLIQMMVGRELLEADAADRTGFTPGPIMLDVRDLTRANVFHNVSLQVRAGEIVGLAGLVGAGRSDVARAIFGADPYDAGRVQIAGQPLPHSSIQQAMQMGLALVPEDRQQLGLVLPMSVAANLSMAVLQTISSAGFVSISQERDLANRLMQELSVRAPGASAPANTLSGGNQQKLVLGKWLATRPRVLILDEPTRGVDVGAKAEVHRLIRKLAAQGMATLLISSDLPEVLTLSDRVVVMRGGEITGDLAGADATQERVLSLAIPQGAAA